MPPSLQDWRDAGADEVASLFEQEAARWKTRLLWDTGELWKIVEAGRRAGHVPGWIARDDEEGTAGWAFYHLHGGSLQIGGLTAPGPKLTRSLLDAILASPEASLATGFSCFVLPEGNGLAAALERQRFDTGESLYLHRSIDPTAPAAAGVACRPWQPLDLAAAARLLESSYASVPGAACFAPSGTRDEWGSYVAQLVHTPGCGRFDQSLSFVSGDIGRIDAAVLTTRLAPAVIHIAQVAVAPEARGRGIASTLLAEVSRRAAAAGATDMTLMVDAANRAARSLYARLGFTQRAAFVHARRRARRRMAA